MSVTKTLSFTVAGTLLGFAAGWLATSGEGQQAVQRAVAISWGDGRYGPAFYGAHIYLDPLDPVGYAVRGSVIIGRGNPYAHDLGELGRVSTPEEAVARFGTIEWADDGLHIGSGPGAVFLPRAQLERHR